KTNVVYTTGEAFMNELIEAIQSGRGRGKYTSNEFRNKFRKADVLLIDDIQFIIGRETTQMEFFHTFNTLYLAGKQIILTSDRPPKEFTKLEKRITSRFGSGIIADIQNPDADLRNAILRTKRDLNKDNIPNEVIDYIANNVESNIRELEGAYIQILTVVNATGTPANVELAENLIGKNIATRNKKAVNPNQILRAVCKYYSIKLSDIKGKRRTRDLVIPRQVAMYLIRDMTEAPLMSIGETLGGRDHTTIMHGIGKVESEMREMGKIRQDVNNVRNAI
ncbi:chromosomal replication initiator protein DnaA, partial [Patescibacteria group bacterium]